MNLYEHIREGEPVEIHIGAIVTRSKVERIDSETTFVILQPTHKLLPIIFDPEESVQFCFFRENGVHSFQGVFTSRGMISNLHVCGFEAVSEVAKNQRRFSYRLPAFLNINIKRKDPKPPMKPEGVTATSVNISQEGILLRCDSRFPQGTHVLMEINLSDTELCIAEGDVLRCMAPLIQGDPYEIAVLFTNLTKRDLAQISRFILSRQVSDRRKRQGV